MLSSGDHRLDRRSSARSPERRRRVPEQRLQVELRVRAGEGRQLRRVARPPDEVDVDARQRERSRQRFVSDARSRCRRPAVGRPMFVPAYRCRTFDRIRLVCGVFDGTDAYGAEGRPPRSVDARIGPYRFVMSVWPIGFSIVPLISRNGRSGFVEIERVVVRDRDQRRVDLAHDRELRVRERCRPARTP